MIDLDLPWPDNWCWGDPPHAFPPGARDRWYVTCPCGFTDDGQAAEGCARDNLIRSVCTHGVGCVRMRDEVYRVIAREWA